jgi:hypothetical protein
MAPHHQKNKSKRQLQRDIPRQLTPATNAKGRQKNVKYQKLHEELS